MKSVEDVVRGCSDCGVLITLRAADWKWWWEKGGRTPSIMHTSAVVCEACAEDDDTDGGDFLDDMAWRSEERLRRMEGWVE